jgi:trehalose 6-phosphate synthase/phosphatase
MSRLLIASNRLPFTIELDGVTPKISPSAGGLVAALRTPHERGAIWIGWPGDVSRLPNGEAAIQSACQKENTVPVFLTAPEVAQYYDAFSNGVLWPLFHYLLDKVQLDATHGWSAYRRVNERFARAIASEYRAGDLVWVHDYQLTLVPRMLRELLPKARIGYFLHVPWPATDVFRILPWRDEVLRGILGADVVGFHTAAYRHNFSFSAARILGIDLGIDEVSYEDRVVRLGVYPIGVDAERIERLARDPEVEERAEHIRSEAQGKKILLGVDRLDYTKGLPRRLLAFDRFLEQHAELRERVHYIQLAVPTRERVDAYAGLRRETNELVGRINSNRGTAVGSPLHFLYRSVADTELIALYRAADLMLVTPLRDGMNLVAKEYVAARVDEQGALVLSEFAGAADELLEALVVNAYDIEAMAAVIHRALEMTPGEQRVRMRAMRSHVATQNAAWWVEKFLAELSSPRMPSFTNETDAPSLRERITHARAAPQRRLVLDYDGTLVPIMPLPELATADDRLIALLVRLASKPGLDLHIVSGRTRDSLKSMLGDVPVTLHAEHGYWTLQDGAWRADCELDSSWQTVVRETMARKVASTPGSFVEEKTTGLAFHYRACDPSLVGEKVNQLREELIRLHADLGFELLPGSKVLEARMRGVSKGGVVERVASSLESRDFLLVAGDDVTDEEMFGAAPSWAITIHVGRARSRAAFQVDDPWGLRELLDQLTLDVPPGQT